MGVQPDRHPGTREEDELRLIEDSTDPTDEGALRYVSGAFRQRDTDGVLDPRNADRIKERDVSASAPDDDDVLTWNDGTSRWEPRETQWQQSSEETRTNSISTGSGSPQNAGGMSITLDAGTYVAWFSATGKASGNFGILAIDLALGGTSVDYSERSVRTPKKNYPLSIATHARFTATQGQVLTGRYWNDGSGNVSLTQRTLTVIRVG